MRVSLIFGAVCTVAFLLACGAPLYKPGSVSQTEVQVEGGLDGQSGQLKVGGGIELAWFARGKGKIVLMVHGGPGYPFTEAWKALEPLEGEYRFVYYDQRGAGESTRPVDRFASKDFYANMLALDTALGPAAQLRDIEAFRKAAGAEKISLIGHSYGGLLAALYAAEYPGRVDSLVLVAPAEVARMPMKMSKGLYGSVGDRLPPGEKKKFEAFMKRFFDYGAIFRMNERELQELNFEFLRYFSNAFPEEGVAEGGIEGGARGGAEGGARGGYSVDKIAGWGQHALFLGFGSRYDLTDSLRRIEARTLIVTGSADFASEPEIMDTYGRIPGAVHRAVSAGHLSYAADTEGFGRAVGEFLAAGR